MTIQDPSGTVYQLLGIEDLVQSKKTQRDKDWPMIRRLVDAHYAEFRDEPRREQVTFWLRESRSPTVLIEVARRFPQPAGMHATTRPLLEAAVSANEPDLERRLAEEASEIRLTDKLYWQPLIDELHRLRQAKRRSGPNQ